MPSGLSRVAVLIVIIISVAGCGVYSPSPTQVAPHSLCGVFISEGDVVCVEEENLVLVQATGDGQGRLRHEALSIVFTGVVQVDRGTGVVHIANLGGRALVSVVGATQSIPVGGVLTLERRGGVYDMGERRVLPFYAGAVQEAMLARLPMGIDLPTPIAPPADYTPPVSVTPTSPGMANVTPSATVCVVREDWGTHSIVRGDTLSRLAQQYQTTLDDLQRANCLIDVNRIQVGQVLRVPNRATITPAFEPTHTPSAVLFRADRTQLSAGDCTTLRWDILNVSAVYLEDEAVTMVGVRSVCLEATTSYRLRVVYFDERESLHTVTITVGE